jgi:hypothetical protein
MLVSTQPNAPDLHIAISTLTRFDTMPGSGIFRVTEEPINERLVSALFGRICSFSHPA